MSLLGDVLRRARLLPPAQPERRILPAIPPAPALVPPTSPQITPAATVSLERPDTGPLAPAPLMPELVPSGGLEVSSAYARLLGRLESISGAVPGKIGQWTWYYDSVGVPTIGYGHALHHPDTGEILHRSIYGAATAELANRAMVKYYGATAISMDQILALKTQDIRNYADQARLMLRKTTRQYEFDMLVDFAYNVGEHSLEVSTLLRLHNAGTCPIGPLDPARLAANSRGKLAIHTVADAFCAWSNADKMWSLGVFHRRTVEAYVYSGMDYDAAYAKAWSFHG